MKKLIYISLVFALLLSCKQQQIDWKGTIEVENGVTIVKNPKEPIYKEDIFHLEEELIIGQKEGSEEYMFSLIAIDVDDNGNIYVLEDKAIEIRVFDKNGTYLYSFGRKGQGPGEMQSPVLNSFQITPQNEILVLDSKTKRIIFFSLQGDYLRQILASTVRGAFIPIKKDSKGNFIICLLNPPLISEFFQELKIFDPKLTPLISLKKVKNKPYQPDVFRAYMPMLRFVLTQDDNIIWGVSNKYEFYIHNSRGEIIEKIYKDYTPVKITRQDKERHEEMYVKKGPYTKIHFPENYPTFRNIYLDDEDRLFVKTYERVKGKEQYAYFDVFDSAGKYIAKVPIKTQGVRQFIWKNEKLYTVEDDEEGYPFVKRYNISWRIK